MLSALLYNGGHLVDTADNGHRPTKILSENRGFGILSGGLKMPRMDVLELTENIQKSGINLSAILLTAHGILDSAAYFLNKFHNTQKKKVEQFSPEAMIQLKSHT